MIAVSAPQAALSSSAKNAAKNAPTNNAIRKKNAPDKPATSDSISTICANSICIGRQAFFSARKLFALRATLRLHFSALLALRSHDATKHLSSTTNRGKQANFFVERFLRVRKKSSPEMFAKIVCRPLLLPMKCNDGRRYCYCKCCKLSMTCKLNLLPARETNCRQLI